LTFSLSYVPTLSAALAHEKGLEAKLIANSKSLKDAQTRLATVEAKCKKDVAATEVKAAKVEKPYRS
jgi:hypothetical protein